MKFLIVVDMQNDFITGSLGSGQAVAVVSKVKKKIENFDGEVIFTRDTHDKNYLNTQEGEKLPVEHCIKNSYGWRICDELLPYVSKITDKQCFGSLELPGLIKEFSDCVEEIELCGLCTDICVISNAMILKAAFPDAIISVDENCCAGVSTTSHNIAIEAMKAVQIEIK